MICAGCETPPPVIEVLKICLDDVAEAVGETTVSPCGSSSSLLDSSESLAR